MFGVHLPRWSCQPRSCSTPCTEHAMRRAWGIGANDVANSFGTSKQFSTWCCEADCTQCFVALWCILFWLFCWVQAHVRSPCTYVLSRCSCMLFTAVGAKTITLWQACLVSDGVSCPNTNLCIIGKGTCMSTIRLHSHLPFWCAAVNTSRHLQLPTAAVTHVCVFAPAVLAVPCVLTWLVAPVSPPCPYCIFCRLQQCLSLWALWH